MAPPEKEDPMVASTSSSTGSSCPDTGVDTLSTSSTSLSTDSGESPPREVDTKGKCLQSDDDYKVQVIKIQCDLGIDDYDLR